MSCKLKYIYDKVQGAEADRLNDIALNTWQSLADSKLFDRVNNQLVMGKPKTKKRLKQEAFIDTLNKPKQFVTYDSTVNVDVLKLIDLQPKQAPKKYPEIIIPEESDILYQNQSVNNEGLIASEKTIRDLVARMSDRIGIPYRIISDRSKLYKGKLQNDKAFINLAYATLDTPIHEIVSHPIIRSLKIKSEKTTDSYIQEMIDKGIIKKEC